MTNVTRSTRRSTRSMNSRRLLVAAIALGTAVVGLFLWLNADSVSAQINRKQSVYDQIASDNAHHQAVAAQSAPPVVTGAVPQPLIDLASKYPQGVIDSRQAPLPSSVYVITNQYQAVVSGIVLHVYAGALRDDSTQGLLYVQVDDPNHVGSRIHGGALLIPGRTGLAKITAGSGSSVSFTTAAGASGAYDAATGRFSSP